jgi:hypothetical protein
VALNNIATATSHTSRRDVEEAIILLVSID